MIEYSEMNGPNKPTSEEGDNQVDPDAAKPTDTEGQPKTKEDPKEPEPSKPTDTEGQPKTEKDSEEALQPEPEDPFGKLEAIDLEQLEAEKRRNIEEVMSAAIGQIQTVLGWKFKDEDAKAMARRYPDLLYVSEKKEKGKLQIRDEEFEGDFSDRLDTIKQVADIQEIKDTVHKEIMAKLQLVVSEAEGKETKPAEEGGQTEDGEKEETPEEKQARERQEAIDEEKRQQAEARAKRREDAKDEMDAIKKKHPWIYWLPGMGYRKAKKQYEELSPEVSGEKEPTGLEKKLEEAKQRKQEADERKQQRMDYRSKKMEIALLKAEAAKDKHPWIYWLPFTGYRTAKWSYKWNARKAEEKSFWDYLDPGSERWLFRFW